MTEANMDRWRDRVALVTGASSGIGRAVAEDLHTAGMRVVVCARRQDRLLALGEKLGSERLWPLSVDLRDVSQIEAMFAQVAQRWGGVDALINNAGLGHASPLSSGDAEQWREMLDVNVLALCVCTREALQSLAKRKVAGHIVHISSMSAHRVPGGSGVYSATKFAVRALTEGLRAELRAAGSATRVTAISPGFVETEFAEKYHRDAAKAAETYARYPTLQPRDIADSVRYVLSVPPHVQVHDVLMRPTDQPS